MSWITSKYKMNSKIMFCVVTCIMLVVLTVLYQDIKLTPNILPYLKSLKISNNLSTQINDVNNVSSHLQEQVDKVNKSFNSGKTIFIWGRAKWLYTQIGPTWEDFRHLGCQQENCRLVDRKSYPVKNIDKVDCIFFNVKDIYGHQYPKRLRTDQVHVFWMFEAPLHWFPVPMKQLNDRFNLTYTFMDHPATDIYYPISKPIQRTSELGKYVLPDDISLGQKNKMAAWIVSNCRPKGQRRNYVHELQKYITVDIYGACGTFNCSRTGNVCMKKIETEYKFYLAFESLYCKDYITEKMYRTLDYNIIPVALGGGNYSNVLPANSYIDVRDFKSPENLAKYLKYLDENDEEYLKYFNWKRNYIVRGNRNNGLCRLCEILHDASYNYKSNFDIGQYWSAPNYCKKGQAEKDILHLH